MPDLASLVRTFWKLNEREDFRAAAAMMTPDATIDWPVSGERIPSPANWRAIKEHYPGTWKITVIDVVVDGETAISRAIVRSDDLGHTETPLTFFTFSGNLISRIVEYWPQPEVPASWRAPWVIPIPEGSSR